MADVYDGFISYSHAADDLLAPRLQSALQRFAKPWWKRRAVRIFRDESSLSANPHLWSSITEALDSSGWFVLLLSPDAAASEWVNQEIAYWVEHRDPKKILPVVTDGTFGWDGEVTGDAVPDALRGVFTEEPRWVDLRFARNEEQLDLQHPEFNSAIADIASTIRGIPKDELATEEVRQHRRTVRTAWAAGGLVTVLAIAAVGFGIQSARNADEAERQAELAAEQADLAEQNAQQARANAQSEAVARSQAEEAARAESEARLLAQARELGASAVNVLEDDPELALLLALEAIERTPGDLEQPIEVINALWEAVQEDRLTGVLDTGAGGAVGIALSVDGRRLAASSANEATVRYYSVPDGVELWSHTEQTTDSFGLPFISPDGERVAVGVWDSAGPPAQILGEAPPDDSPARVVILDSQDGSSIATIEYPDCPGANAMGWSPLGSYFAVSHVDACPRPGASNDSWVEILDGATFDPVALVDTIEGFVPIARFDQAENLYVFGTEERRGVEIYRPPSFDITRVAEELTGLGDISPDGSSAVLWDAGGGGFGFAVFDVDTGRRTDLLRPTPDFPGGFHGGPTFSPNGDQVIMADVSAATPVWDIESGERIFHLGGGPATNAAMSPDGKWLYTGHIDGTVKIWTLETAGGLQAAGDLGRFRWINANAFSIGSELGAAVAIDIPAFEFQMVFFDRATGAFRGEPVPAWTIPAVPLAEGRFALRSLVGEWVVYDPMTATQVYLAGCPTDRQGRVCAETGDPVPEISVLASIEGSELAISVDGSSTVLVDPDTGSSLGPLAPDLDLRIDVLARDWLLGFDSDSSEHVAFDRVTGEELARFTLPRLFRWEVSETGRTIAVLEELQNGLTVVDTESWTTRSISFDLGNVRGLAISPDETQVALGDESGLHIVNLKTGALEQSIPLPSISDIHWFDGRSVLVGGTDGIWARIPLEQSDLIALARRNLTRGFTALECQTYRIDPCPTLEELRGG